MKFETYVTVERVIFFYPYLLSYYVDFQLMISIIVSRRYEKTTISGFNCLNNFSGDIFWEFISYCV